MKQYFKDPRRSDEIAARAGEPGAGLGRIFSRKEIGVTNGICCELALVAVLVGILIVARLCRDWHLYGGFRIPEGVSKIVTFVSPHDASVKALDPHWRARQEREAEERLRKQHEEEDRREREHERKFQLERQKLLMRALSL